MAEFDVHTLAGRRAVARWERLSVGDVFERLTWSRPEKEALIAAPGAATGEFRRLTYREADLLANQVANALLARGLQRSDRVVLFCDNSVEAIIAKIAIAKAGLVCAPVNTMMAPDVVAHLIERIEPRFAIVDAELWPRAAEAFAQTGLRADVTIELGGSAADVPGSTSFGEFAASGGAVEPVAEIHGDDIWQLLFTSGTTALPKAVMISHTYTHLAAQQMAMALTRGLPQEDRLRLCSFLPVVFHVGDQIFAFASFLAGGTMIVGRRPGPVQIARTISQEHATALWGGAPAMLQGLAEALDADPALDARSLTIALYGWAALAPETLTALERHTSPEFQVMAIFGQTEAISCHRFYAGQHPDLYQRTAPQDNYVGVPNPLLGSRVVDETGAEIPPGQAGVPGEVVYRSPVVTAGYYRDETATAHAFRDGWFHSGDALAHGEDDQRVMLDRYKDIVKSGGENVSSLRVEAILMRHPEITAVAVVGLPHEYWGEAVTAFVILRSGAGEDTASIVSWARERLAGFETPKAVVAVGELPTTVGGKVLKHKLRAAHASHYAADPLNHV